MLSDTERKILRILWNQNKHEWFRLDQRQLCRLSQRNPGRVEAAIKSLVDQRYIDENSELYRVVMAWEDNSVSSYMKPWEV